MISGKDNPSDDSFMVQIGIKPSVVTQRIAYLVMYRITVSALPLSYGTVHSAGLLSCQTTPTETDPRSTLCIQALTRRQFELHLNPDPGSFSTGTCVSQRGHCLIKSLSRLWFSCSKCIIGGLEQKPAHRVGYQDQGLNSLHTVTRTRA